MFGPSRSFDNIEDARIASERHPIGAELVWLRDLLDETATAVVSERLQFETVGAFSKSVRTRRQLVGSLPQMLDVLRRDNVLECEVAIVSPEILLLLGQAHLRSPSGRFWQSSQAWASRQYW